MTQNAKAETLYPRDAVFKAAMDLILNAEPADDESVVVRKDLLLKLQLAMTQTGGRN